MEDEKIIKDIAKTARIGIEAAEKLGKFFGEILGGGFSYIGSAFADWAQVYRYKNLLKLIDEVNEIHRQRGIEGKLMPLLPKHAIPILDKASLEDDENLRSLWAALIANATDPENNFKINRLYIDILSSLDSVDVLILDFLEKEFIDEKYGIHTNAKLNSIEISKNIHAIEEEVKISLSNLYRQGLIIDSWEQTLESLDRGYSGVRVNNSKSNFRLSYLGKCLVEECKYQ